VRAADRDQVGEQLARRHPAVEWVLATAARIESGARVRASSPRNAPSSSIAAPIEPWTPVWISSAEPCVSAVKLPSRPSSRGRTESIRCASAQLTSSSSITSSSIPTV
jgi:hypothetical protein